MASAAAQPVAARSDDRFFFIMALVMAATIFAGFSLQLAVGRSCFARPWLVHAHAVVFMGWVVLYVLQNSFVALGQIKLHRMLGRVALGWLALMVVLGIAVTVRMVRAGEVPFVFQPLHFLVFDSITLITAAALIGLGVANHRRTDWHRRLNYTAMAVLTGPAFGRLLPMPLLIPWAYHGAWLASLLFPLIGIIADARRVGRVHPAWLWGLAAVFAAEGVTDAISFTPLGQPLYRAVTAGSPGAAIAPLAFPGQPMCGSSARNAPCGQRNGGE